MTLKWIHLRYFVLLFCLISHGTCGHNVKLNPRTQSRKTNFSVLVKFIDLPSSKTSWNVPSLYHRKSQVSYRLLSVLNSDFGIPDINSVCSQRAGYLQKLFTNSKACVHVLALFNACMCICVWKPEHQLSCGCSKPLLVSSEKVFCWFGLVLSK